MQYIKKKLIIRIFCFFVGSVYSYLVAISSPQINLIGFIRDIRSISRHTTSFIDCLHDEFPITLVQTQKCSDIGLDDVQQKIIQESFDIRDYESTTKAINHGLCLDGVTIYTASQWGSAGKQRAWQNYLKIPNRSSIRYAYHVIESTAIPNETVVLFNTYFDAVIIPDPWAVDVYKKMGVIIPVFSLPLVLDLESLLKQDVKKWDKKQTFIFGFSGVDAPRKNHKLLIEAFAKEFGNNPEVCLYLHCRFNNVVGLNRIRQLIKKSGARNITLIQKAFTRNEYEAFISSLSCYVILSKGEGFSITPREALAAGVPCIVSNNTAQKTLCDSDFVEAVPSEIKELAYNEEYKKKMGAMFNCTVSDTRKALRDLYQNYDHHWQSAQRGREWVKQYLVNNLKKKYHNLVQPKKVILGDENKVTDEYLMTSSKKFFNKFNKMP